jgi:uncharacterized protein (TIGR00297 family)
MIEKLAGSSLLLTMFDHIWLSAFVLLVSFISLGLRLLAPSGSIAAAAAGICIGIGTGWRGLVLLGLFFLTSSVWSVYKKNKKAAMEEKLGTGARRNWLQVAANGGLAAAFSLIYSFDPQLLWLAGFSISLASANSDTWSSEIGALSKSSPLSIRTWRRTASGTSGAVSALGSAAGAAGALLIAGGAALLFPFTAGHVLAIFLFGCFGNILDTFIGAYWQASYRCAQCGLHIEKSKHCGIPADLVSGFRWMTNDAVNVASGLAASLLGIGYLLWVI